MPETNCCIEIVVLSDGASFFKISLPEISKTSTEPEIPSIWRFSKYSRNELKSIIEKAGGKNSSSISKKTTFILAGENMGPAKLEKAQELGVPILSEQEFLDLLQL